MNINDDLLNKFDSIEDLPISEEMLCAYNEGNLRGAELREVQNFISSDGLVADLYEDIVSSSPMVDDIRFNDIVFEDTMADFEIPFDLEEIELPVIAMEFPETTDFGSIVTHNEIYTSESDLIDSHHSSDLHDGHHSSDDSYFNNNNSEHLSGFDNNDL